MKPPVIVCPADYNYRDFHIQPPAKFLASLNNAKTSSSDVTAQFVVTYNGFEEFQEAKNAFQFAVDIWSTLIKSDVPIYIDATFKELGSGVLGSAGTSGLYKGFKGAPNDSLFYNVALAEKIVARGLNVDGEPDISASFSSTFDWYLGTDGNTNAGQYDFVSVVLHEIGHGLGFFALNGYDESNNQGTRNPGAFDIYIEDGNGVSVFDIPNGTTELGDYYTNNNLFINAPLSVISNGGSSPKIFAPSTYNGGSSISHWDENTYNGTENALLTPQFSPGESIHNPGPNMMSLFANMGWVHTYLKHQPALFIDNLVDGMDVVLEVSSDTTLAVVSPELHYSFDNFATQTDQLLTANGNGNYSFTIPNPGVESVLQYYITGISDVLDRDYTSPSVSTERHKTVIRNLSSVAVPYTLADGGDFESPSEFTQTWFKGNVDVWEQGIPENVLNVPSSGTQVWKTDLKNNLLQPSADYTTALISPKYDLSDTTADYNIKFDLSMDVAVPAAGFSVMYSIDGGINWLDLGAPNDGRGVNWMNISEEYFLFESGNGWVFKDTLDIPREASYNLSEIIGNGESEVYFALLASVTNIYSDETYDFDGMMIDDFEITKTEPRAFFSTSSTSINFPGKDIQFNYISKGAETFSWDFGDGQFSTEKNPIHAYQNGGVYDVSLTITYPGGAGTHTFTKAALVYVINKKGPNYTLAEGGDMESNFNDFLVDNIKGTPFELGMSSVPGKSGTASGVNAWVTGITEDQYENQSEAFLYTPIFDFSLLGSYQLSFKANYALEEGWDAFILEYSVDNGESWEQVNPVVEDGWYDIIGEDNVAQGWPAIPLFSGNTGDIFETKSVDLTDFSGLGEVSFRFYFKTDFAALDVGMALDDFILTGPQGSANVDFTLDGNNGCEGQVVTFTNTSTGSITSLNWDFGANATPATGDGVGPFDVTYSGMGESVVTLTLISPIDGTLVSTKSLTTAPQHTPSYVSESVSGNDAQQTLIATDGDAFQWFINNDSIIGANQKTYLAEKSGDYSVSVDVGGCIGTSNGSSIITSIIDDLESRGVFIYPNPVSKDLFIDLVNEYRGEVELKIINNLGKEFYRGAADKRDINFAKKIDVSNYSKGIYIIELWFGGIRDVRKVIIE
jgi:PKD repeat protein